VSRSVRGPAAALVALLVVLSAPLNADAARTSRTLPGPPQEHTDFTRAEAQELLDEAQSQIKRDTGREEAGLPVGSGESTDITLTLRDLFRARSKLTPAEREAADKLLSRPSEPWGDDVGGPAVVYPEKYRGHWCPPEGVACVHWVTRGAEKISTADADADGLPDYVETVYATMKRVWDHEIGTMGYRMPLPDGGTPDDEDNPTPGLDVYLADLGSRGLYGYCAPEGRGDEHQLGGYCVLDNDYAYDQYGTAPNNALRVTAAHEFFHAIQFAYDVDEDAWLMEGSATWIEDEVYDSINDNRQFLAYSPLRYPRSPLDYSSGLHRYGAWLFFRYASERFGTDVVRDIWEQAEWPAGKYSLQAVQSVVETHTTWQDFIALFAGWNTLPAGSYSERAGYPSPAWNLQKTLTSTSTSTGWRQVNLPHLSSTAVRVVPHSKLSTRKRLEIRVDAPYASKGPTALLQRRMKDGRVLHSTIKLDRYGNGKAVTSFDRTRFSSVAVVVANTSTAMRSCGSVTNADGPIYSCAGRGVYDSNQPYKVRARLL
jgi:hypothetical protein